MTYYDFLDDQTGERFELDLPMGTAPAPGEEGSFEIDGRRRVLRRLVTAPAAQIPAYHNDDLVPGQGGIKVWSQRPHRREGPDPRGFKHHDTDGIPIVRSKAEIKEVEARTADTLDPIRWTK